MAKKTTGEIQGSTILKKRRQYEAPSMTAASISGFGTPWSAAMKMIMKKPAFFHTSMKTIDIIALRLEVSQCTGEKPRRMR